MWTGCTPTLTFEIEGIPEGAEIDDLWISFKNLGMSDIILRKTLDDVTIDDNIITLKLTQEETLSFRSKVECQIKVKFVSVEDTVAITQKAIINVEEAIDKEIM